MRKFVHDPVKRFQMNVTISEGCWLWTGTLDKDGYGKFQLKRKQYRAHRAVFMLFRGVTPPSDLVSDHLCRVRNCVNPEHIEFVSSRENTMRGLGPAAINKAKTHCWRGHELSSENVWVARTGRRHCRACAKIARDKTKPQQKAWRERNREKLLESGRLYRLARRAARIAQ